MADDYVDELPLITPSGVRIVKLIRPMGLNDKLERATRRWLASSGKDRRRRQWKNALFELPRIVDDTSIVSFVPDTQNPERRWEWFYGVAIVMDAIKPLVGHVRGRSVDHQDEPPHLVGATWRRRSSEQELPAVSLPVR
jgi:hypothetical protein